MTESAGPEDGPEDGLEGQPDDLITKTAAAEVAGVSERTIETWVANGYLTAWRQGPTGYWVRFSEAEIREAMEARASAGSDGG